MAAWMSSRIPIEEVGLRCAFAQLAKNQLYWDSRPANHRLTEHHTRVHFDAVGERHLRPLSGNSIAQSHFGVCGKSFHRLVGDGNPLTASELRIGFVEHREELEAFARAFFPQRQRFLKGFFLARKPAALDGLLDECALVGRQLDVHAPIVAPDGHGRQERYGFRPT